MLNYLYGLVVCLLAMLTQGCGATGYESYCGLRRMDTFQQTVGSRDNTTGDWWHNLVDKREPSQLSGSN